MTTAPTRHLTDATLRTTILVGATPFAPKPITAANIAFLRVVEPPFDFDPPVPNGTAATARRENTPPTPLAAVRPVPKSP